jgi:hypothetical protein
MNKKVLIFLVVVLLVTGGYFYLNTSREEVNNFEECVAAGYSVMESYPQKCTTSEGETFTEDIGNLLEKEDVITVSTPKPNTKIESPLLVEGEARGTWFFEANFGVKLVNENGEVIAEAPATAQGEWMTEDFVPYSAELEFEAPEDGEGRLILEKANPSGMEENDDQVEFPIEF